jgi:murein DD-endopeptidase MepM/ murein hydrolase activator NlpD
VNPGASGAALGLDRRRCLRWLATYLLAGAGCAQTRQVLSQSKEGRAVMTQLDEAGAEFDRYLAHASRYLKNTASGPLSSLDVQRVLRGAGVGAPAPRPAPGTPTPAPGPAPPAAKPFPVPVYSGGYRWPLEAGIVSSEFGQRWGKGHQGIDVAADRGVPVYAAAPGEVIYAGSTLGGYGNAVIIRHDQKTSTLYGHNSALKVRKGDEVKHDQMIALLGSTGRSTGPHVHFEVRDSDNAINPREVLPKSRF